MRELNQTGVDLIKSFEGIRDGDPSTVNLDPYVDPVGIYTIGWGHAIVWGQGFLRTSTPNSKAIAKQLYPDGLTMAQAETLLRNDLHATSIPVEGLVKVPISDNQFAALVSFAFNVGVNNLRNSTLLRKLNARDYGGAALEFAKWNKAGGRVLAGLTRRRTAEATLFRTP
ncbi:MAG TPA: lysozyme [Pyrinomonadaceae bacterium]|nr:lysozyme [Pyrinomonadaceae bacterium]